MSMPAGQLSQAPHGQAPGTHPADDVLLEIKGLKTHFHTDRGVVKAVDGVDLVIRRNRTIGIVGESGCGKSIMALSIMGLVPQPPARISGEILFHRKDGTVVDLAKLDPKGKEIRSIRGAEIAMIFQEPIASLSPVHTIGEQILEMVLLHRTKNRKEAREIVLDMLAKVGLPNPTQRFNEYPHQLSGGMCQRAMIAMALSCSPALLIADEPTTALDVTVQAQIIELIRGLQAELGMSVLYITHDLGVIAEVADMVAVMYLGRIVELADTRTLFKHPLHPYTRRLLKALPSLTGRAGDYLENIQGNVPVPLDPPAQCGFFSRCQLAQPGLCDAAVPPLLEVEPGHYVRCALVSGEGGAQ